MKRLRSILPLLGVLAVLPGNQAEAQDSLQDNVRRIRAEGLDPALQAESLAALRKLASGNSLLPETREAALELALYRGDFPDSDRPHQVIAELIAAVTLFPDDDRVVELLPTLARIQLEIGDPYGAHLALRDYHRRRGKFDNAEQAALAAFTAAEASDMRNALAWTEPWLTSAMSDKARAQLLIARLKSAAALSRWDMATETIQSLELHAAEAFRLDGDAVLTAATVLKETGQLEQARQYYSVLVNVHPRRSDHATSLLELSRLQRTTGQPLNSQETVLWLRRAHDATPQVLQSRLEELEIDFEVPIPKMIPAYQELVRDARSMSWIENVCDTLFNRLTGGGFPLEAISGIFEIVRDDPDGLPSMVIRRRANRYIAAAMELLQSRGASTAVASIASAALELDIPIPPAVLGTVNRARAELGLHPVFGGRVDLNLQDARTLFDEGLYGQVALRLRRLVGAVPAGETVPDWYVEANALLAEAYWREGEDEQALARLNAALDRLRNAAGRRELLVLKADILLASDPGEACVSYRLATEIRESAWTRKQTSYCDRLEPESTT